MKVFIRSRDVGRLNVMMADGGLRGAALDDPHVIIADREPNEVAELKASGHFDVYEDIQFKLFDWWKRAPKAAPASTPWWATKTMNDVMDHIGATAAWATSTGRGVTIAVIDTGTDLSSNQFPNRSTQAICHSFPTAYADHVGHGSMCAAIACGTNTSGGRYKGVAPDATLLTARTDLTTSDLYLIFQDLLRLKRRGEFAGGLVVSNSYGLYTCTPPDFPEGHPYVDLVRLCVSEGIVFVFAAGNNHGDGLCKYSAQACSPNTIWAVNSIDEVITVGTVDKDNSNHAFGSEHSNSSRGPGQWSIRKDKPDVVAPTYGEVVWGGGYQRMEWWGTSGACPQVAGLAALMLAVNPNLRPEEIRAMIRASAQRPPGGNATCIGDGVIDCRRAVEAAKP